ncbi:MAG TPA: 1-(5-phosphoribosyl)-5-[(5-phosphoribosylamino)methylideneamino]imidazole-4-carboxamide isomerase [Actinomycetota bacterium]|nr:1-(5-phosphoribosyl)-5-[(5-phosphoribosylamino)methylideneamino]imidazole-4-carboxamide isomerase [Actinomycetota bacterium]
MQILVAVDIVEDQVVRLRQGELKERTVYGDNPVEAALRWEREGAEWLHVVDLDGATKGAQANSRAVEQILAQTNIPVQVGGGIRTIEAIGHWLDAGAARVVIGTKSLDKEFLTEAVAKFGDRLVAAVDARRGRVRIEGWQESSGITTVDTLKSISESGAGRIMFTDIERDGTLLGPNIDAIEEVLDAVGAPLIASGGVSSDHDIRSLARLQSKGLEGVIVGKALYSGALTLEEAKLAAG